MGDIVQPATPRLTPAQGYNELREILLVLERVNPEAMKCSREPWVVHSMLL